MVWSHSHSHGIEHRIHGLELGKTVPEWEREIGREGEQITI